jgi:hypothetical protein
MKIVTAVVNNPVFIEIQYHTLKKYLRGLGEEGYEFIVFNDAKAFPDYTNGGDITLRGKIEDTCKALGIKCIPVKNDHHRDILVSSDRVADSMNAILRYQLDNPPDTYLLLDSDMFLIDYLNITKYNAFDCAVVLQSRNQHKVNYIWNGLYYFDFYKMTNTHLLDWNLGGKNCDTGGMMRQWLATQTAGEALPNTDDLRWLAGDKGKNKTFHSKSVYYIRHLWSCSWNETELPENYKDGRPELLQFLKEDVRNVNGKFYCEIYDDVFLHYRAGGNWNNEGMALHNKMTDKLKKLLLH